ncbi:DUF4124 domain-containing protein [Microbulbifer mangrovi]|uniref:DUF4124 domain-containing protein n=1 Tax=Microbulbifer mangrovi TaxID=927787 RepID=UPI0009904A87|nr:DUF4124 domain-containing protein [Microbulbifer mangrovi]
MRAYLLLAILLIPRPLIAALYQCTDVDGHTSFQDTPCAGQIEERNLDEAALSSRINISGEKGAAIKPRFGNRVFNGDFSQGIEGWSAEKNPHFFQWATSSGLPETGALAVQSTPPEHPKERRIYNAELSQCVPLEDGRRYRLSARYQPVGFFKARQTNRINLVWYKSEDCSTGGTFAAYLEPKPSVRGWQQVTRDRLLRNLSAKSAKITVSQSRTSAKGEQAMWDDIALEPLEFQQTSRSATFYDPKFTRPLGANYVFNGNFSQQLNGWQTSGDTRWTAGEGKGYTGGARLAITSAKGGYGAHTFSQCINIGADRVFSAAADVKVDSRSNQEGGGIFRVSWYEETECKGSSESAHREDNVEYIDGWQRLTISRLEAPPNAQSVKLRMTRGVRDTGSFAFFLDNIELRSIP